MIDLNEMIKLYLEGCSSIELSKKYNCSNQTILNKLRKNNIEIRRYSNKNKRIKNVDLNFFKNIDNGDKAYLLGLLISDGSVDNGGYGFNFTSKDLNLVETFKKILKSEHKICEIKSYDKRTLKTYKRYCIHICSKDMVNDLFKMGITNNKSFDCPMPNIKEEFFWDLLRGLFDGDGTAVDYGDGRVRLSFVLSSPMMKIIKQKLIKMGLSDIKVTTVSKNSDGFEVQSIKFNSFKDVNFIKNKMYEKANYKLDRKYDIVVGVKEHKRGSYKRVNTKKIKAYDLDNNLINIYDNIDKCMESLSIKKAEYIYRVIRGERNHTGGYKFKYIN